MISASDYRQSKDTTQAEAGADRSDVASAGGRATRSGQWPAACPTWSSGTGRSSPAWRTASPSSWTPSRRRPSSTWSRCHPAALPPAAATHCAVAAVAGSLCTPALACLPCVLLPLNRWSTWAGMQHLGLCMQGESVFVAAHTSAGKTVVAEYAFALAVSRACAGSNDHLDKCQGKADIYNNML